MRLPLMDSRPAEQPAGDPVRPEHTLRAPPDALVIGGGQAGLAAGYHLRRAGLRALILEAGAEPVGSWPAYDDSLTLFSPARYSSLPGLPFPGDPDRYPRRDQVVAWPRRWPRSGSTRWPCSRSWRRSPSSSLNRWGSRSCGAPGSTSTGSGPER
jgi:choline dehydrogenase-like flavoprotein